MVKEDAYCYFLLKGNQFFSGKLLIIQNIIGFLRLLSDIYLLNPNQAGLFEGSLVRTGCHAALYILKGTNLISM